MNLLRRLIVTNPRPGPRNGVIINMMEGTARAAGRNVSLMVPAAMAKGDAKQKPAQNRRIQTAGNVVLRPTPRVNKLPSEIEAR